MEAKEIISQFLFYSQNELENLLNDYDYEQWIKNKEELIEKFVKNNIKKDN